MKTRNISLQEVLFIFVRETYFTITWVRIAVKLVISSVHVFEHVHRIIILRHHVLTLLVIIDKWKLLLDSLLHCFHWHVRHYAIKKQQFLIFPRATNFQLLAYCYFYFFITFTQATLRYNLILLLFRKFTIIKKILENWKIFFKYHLFMYYYLEWEISLKFYTTVSPLARRMLYDKKNLVIFPLTASCTRNCRFNFSDIKACTKKETRSDFMQISLSVSR